MIGSDACLSNFTLGGDSSGIVPATDSARLTMTAFRRSDERFVTERLANGDLPAALSANTLAIGELDALAQLP